LIFIARLRRFGLGLGRLQQQTLDHLAANLADFTLQRTHTGFTGVIPHNIAYRVFLDHQLAFLDAVVLHQLGQQVIKAMCTFSSSVYPDRRITSMRSSSAGGMFSVLLVATNMTSDRSKSTSTE